MKTITRKRDISFKCQMNKRKWSRWSDQIFIFKKADGAQKKETETNTISSFQKKIIRHTCSKANSYLSQAPLFDNRQNGLPKIKRHLKQDRD